MEFTEKGDTIMAICFFKLMDILNRRDMKKGDLMKQANISNATMAKLSANKVVQTDIIDRICASLNCQPGDIMEYVASTDVVDDEL